MFEFFKNTTCKHEKISPQSAGGYCPDCGEFVQNQWYITRCTCCGVKQKTLVKNGRVVANIKFCPNCGNDKFVPERLENIDVVNINYAAIIKKVVEYKKQNYIQYWIDKNAYTPKLLPSY